MLQFYAAWLQVIRIILYLLCWQQEQDMLKLFKVNRGQFQAQSLLKNTTTNLICTFNESSCISEQRVEHKNIQGEWPLTFVPDHNTLIITNLLVKKREEFLPNISVCDSLRPTKRQKCCRHRRRCRH